MEIKFSIYKKSEDGKTLLISNEFISQQHIELMLLEEFRRRNYWIPFETELFAEIEEITIN